MSNRSIIPVNERIKVTMQMLVRAAENKCDCPGNAEIATAIGAASMSAGANIISTLETMGLIQVQRGRMSRVVTIVATGARTKGAIKSPVKAAKRDRKPPSFWNHTRDATLMEAMSQGLDFEQAANWIGCGPEICAARFDELASAFGAQAA
jgi:hypothetical protein